MLKAGVVPEIEFFSAVSAYLRELCVEMAPFTQRTQRYAETAEITF
jgi:hypothetical protein